MRIFRLTIVHWSKWFSKFPILFTKNSYCFFFFFWKRLSSKMLRYFRAISYIRAGRYNYFEIFFKISTKVLLKMTDNKCRYIFVDFCVTNDFFFLFYYDLTGLPSKLSTYYGGSSVGIFNSILILNSPHKIKEICKNKAVF